MKCKYVFASLCYLGAISPVFQVESLVAQQQSPGASIGVHDVSQEGAVERRSATFLDRKIELIMKDATVESALDQVRKKGSVRLMYKDLEIPLKNKVRDYKGAVTVREALGLILQGTNVVVFELPSQGIRLSVGTPATNIENPGDTGVVIGMVVDSASGNGVGGATVSIAATKLSALTSDDGKFRIIRVPAGEYQLTVKLFGYKSITRSIKISPNTNTPVRIALVAVSTTLAGVVTTATGMQRRIEIGNDVTRINADSIMKVAPITTITDLLEGRVPGLDVARTSGAPGAPSKIRIRGVGSMNATNDPIVIVDGIRVYAAQGNTGDPSIGLLGSEFGRGVDRSTNMVGGMKATGLTAVTGTTGSGWEQRALVSSPIDQIDPNSIETIEVLKGPSAVALYGTDAANGVIVITTKRGKIGPVRTGASIVLNTETMPGKWPENYWMWGEAYADFGMPIFTEDVDRDYRIATLVRRQCSVRGAWGYVPRAFDCVPDSLERYQILNNKTTTAFGRGYGAIYRTDVSGGTGNISYSLTGSYGSQTGYLKMPDVDVKLLEGAGESVPEWQRRPQTGNNQGGTARVDVSLKPNLSLSLSSMLTRNGTTTTPLQRAIQVAASLPPARARLRIDRTFTTAIGSGLLQEIEDFRKKITSRTIGFTNKLDGRYSPVSTLSTQLTVGMDYQNRMDMAIEERRDCSGCEGTLDLGEVYNRTSLGEYSTGQGNTFVNTVRMSGTHTYQLPRFVGFRTTFGGDYVRTVTNDMIRNATDIPKGATSGNVAGTVISSERVDDRISAGMYIETRVSFADKIYLPLALRRDAASGISSKSLPSFPKLSLSYVISDASGFSSIPIIGKSDMFRARIAYGQSGVQPSIAARLRGIRQYNSDLDGLGVAVANVFRLGNESLRPERSQEMEGGFDISVWNSRAEINFTTYRKITKDALVTERLPLSLGDPSSYGIQRNFGEVLNNGIEITANTRIVSAISVNWDINAVFSANRNKLQKLGDQYQSSTLTSSSQRYVEGYPLNGRWARPIIGYTAITDDNGDKYLGTVVLGDSMVYLGSPMPKYSLSLNNNLTLFGRLSFNASFLYEHGKNQLNDMIARNMGASRALNDPSTPLATQAYYRSLNSGNNLPSDATDIGVAQEISSLQFNSLSLNFNIPRKITKALHTERNFSVGVQGRNIALYSNYRGKDPNVSNSMSEVFRDMGAIPQARAWIITFRTN